MSVILNMPKTERERPPMPSPRPTLLLLFLALLWACLTVSAQAAAPIASSQSSDAVLLRQLGQSAGGATRMARHAETGKVRFLATEAQLPLWRSSSVATSTPEQVS